MSNRDLILGLQTLYADLVQQVAIAPVSGTSYQRERDGTNYHYAKIPVGSERIDRFIGKVGDPSAEAEVEQLKRAMSLAKGRRQTVSMLKSAGLAGPDRSLGAALDAIAFAGLFRDGAVLIGTAAYLISEPFVGQRLPAPLVMTGDLDLATANIALCAEPPATMVEILRRADPSYAAVMRLDPRKSATRFINSRGYVIDLLTPARRREEQSVPLKALDAAAEPLQHLRWLIEQPLPAVALWGAGVAVKIPQPTRYAVHKLIVAQRRHPIDRIKRQKDLAQAAAMMAALKKQDRFGLEDMIDDARSRGKAWREAIDRSILEIDP